MKICLIHLSTGNNLMTLRIFSAIMTEEKVKRPQTETSNSILFHSETTYFDVIFKARQ